MKPINTHPLIATTEELDSKEISNVSLQGECPKNETISEFHERQVRYISEAFFSADSAPMENERLDWLVREYSDFMSRRLGNNGFYFEPLLRLLLFYLHCLFGR